MTRVVFLRGVNVGGHKTFRPSALAAQLKHLDAVSIGAAGTFVIRRNVGVAQLRDEFARRLPFQTQIMICRGQEIIRLTSRDFFHEHAASRDVVRFVSVLSRSPRSAPSTPMTLPPSGRWLVKVVGRDNRFVVGLYRRQMEAIRYLGTLDRLFGVAVTTRNWNTMMAIAEVLQTGYSLRKGALNP